MRTLQTALVGVALLIASAAYADRTYNLEGTVKFSALGQRLTEDVSGTLTLFDDGTYEREVEGDVSSGIWLQEGKNIQLLSEDPTASEFVAQLEEEVSAGAGMDVSVTSIRATEKIKRTKTGDLKLKSKFTITFRPGPGDGRALKLKVSEKLEGLLQ